MFVEKDAFARTCEGCVHFYSIAKNDNGEYVLNKPGVCFFPRQKVRMPGTKACGHYKKKIFRNLPYN